MLSRKFITSVKCNRLRAYEIAQLAGMHPSALSRLINGIDRIRPNDERVVRVGKILGLHPGECFDQKAA